MASLMSDRKATYLSDLLREVDEEIVEARALQAQFPRLLDERK